MTKLKLDKPLGGWSSLEVDDKDKHSHVTISYVDGDVASYILKELYKYLTFNSTYISLEFDGEEVGDQLVVVAGKSCCMWENIYETHCKTFNISPEDFIEQMLNEIEKNLTELASFGVFVLTDEEYNTELEKSKKKLKKLINKVRKELASYRYTFNGLEKKRKGN